MKTTETALLQAAAARASRRPGFLAYDLTRFHELTGDDPAEWMGVTDKHLTRLALCRTPRRGSRFGHDVAAIAAHVGIEPVALASLIQLAEILPELQQMVSQPVDSADENRVSPGLLTAARDRTDEHTTLSETHLAAPGLPGWLHDAVNRFWATAPAASGFPRDLDFAVLVGLPLAVVELPELSNVAIAEWLTAHKVDLNLSGPDRRIRACLIALGGIGLVFVDAGDDAIQRRVSLAHEAAHFVVEYLLPRNRIAHRRPDLLPVLDGQRLPTAEERLSAILSDVPIGIHTHLLDSNGHTDHRLEMAEWRARRVALELLAPHVDVQRRMRERAVRRSEDVRQMLVEDFGLPVSLAEDYAEQLTGSSGISELGWLDILGRPTAASATHDSRSQPQPDRSSEASPEEEE